RLGEVHHRAPPRRARGDGGRRRCAGPRGAAAGIAGPGRAGRGVRRRHPRARRLARPHRPRDAGVRRRRPHRPAQRHRAPRGAGAVGPAVRRRIRRRPARRGRLRRAAAGGGAGRRPLGAHRRGARARRDPTAAPDRPARPERGGCGCAHRLAGAGREAAGHRRRRHRHRRLAGRDAAADGRAVGAPPLPRVGDRAYPGVMQTTPSVRPFEVVSEYAPSGDQPQAIAELAARINAGETDVVLLGATGTGKSATTAWLIEQVQRPTLVLAHNKTLAAQLANEFRDLMPHNAVEYFVSYYDYYQPEAYVPQTDTFIEKDSSINAEVER